MAISLGLYPGSDLMQITVFELQTSAFKIRQWLSARRSCQ